MKKNQVNSILINQSRRRKIVLSFICLIVITFAMAMMLFMLYAEKSKNQYVSYNEKSYIDYQVLYKENDFFNDKYLESNRQYISSLINNIKTDFNYEISLDDVDVQYKYAYRIEANVVVRDKDNKNLFYDTKEDLLGTVEQTTTQKKISINESLIVDYNLYNDKATKLVNIYDLQNAESFLNINMYINVIGSCEEFQTTQENEKVITLQIPLTKETIAIDFVDNTVNSSHNLILCNSASPVSIFYLILSIGLILLTIILIIIAIKYELQTRTAETIYEKALKKILNNYGSCIQMLGSEFDFNDYQLLKIDNFSDILEISDKLRQPILMRENDEKNGAYFVIPSTTKLLYVYRLKVSDIEKEMNKKSKKQLEETTI